MKGKNFATEALSDTEGRPYKSHEQTIEMLVICGISWNSTRRASNIITAVSRNLFEVVCSDDVGLHI